MTQIYFSAIVMHDFETKLLIYWLGSAPVKCIDVGLSGYTLF